MFLGGPLDGLTAAGMPRGGGGNIGSRFVLINRHCAVRTKGAPKYRRHLYEVVGRRPGKPGEVEVLAEHIRPVA